MSVDVLSAPPSPLSVFSGALLSMTKRGREPTLPALALALEDVRTDPERLRAYCNVCGFADSNFVPALWPHVLAFPLRMKLMSDPRFPFPLPGLVHLENHTEQRRAIRADERLRVECRVGQSEPHEKGITFAMHSVVSIAGVEVWHDESVLLFRTRALGVPARIRDDADQPVEQPDSSLTWSLPGDLGRRYGRASGDLNPIHLHPLSARLFGFPRAIAHGMWSAARGLSALPCYTPDSALRYSVWLKLPIFLPNQVVCRQAKLTDGGRFELRDESDTKPHVRGRLWLGEGALTTRG